MQDSFKPTKFQKLILNSVDEEFGRSFKYDLHPEEKLALLGLE
jgi:hypothetical protein